MNHVVVDVPISLRIALYFLTSFSIVFQNKTSIFLHLVHIQISWDRTVVPIGYLSGHNLIFQKFSSNVHTLNILVLDTPSTVTTTRGSVAVLQCSLFRSS